MRNTFSNFCDFLVLEIWSINLNNLAEEKIFVPKDAQFDFLVHEFFYVVISSFELWSILYSTSVVNWSGT